MLRGEQDFSYNKKQDEESMNSEIANSEIHCEVRNTLGKLRFKNINRLIVAHININSIRNKFELLASQITGLVDIFMISESKLDSSFPVTQFLISGFSSPYRIDRNCNGGGILVYIRDDIPSKVLKDYNVSVEGIFIELNLNKKKWLICCSYNPNKNSIKTHLSELGSGLDLYSSKYDNFLLMGDFNAEPKEPSMSEFLQLYNLKNLINTPTCYKNPVKPSCIDLILTNRPKTFHSSCAIETGLSDFHKMTVSVMKTYFQKQEPKIVCYRDYRRFSNETFRNDVFQKLSQESASAYQLGTFHEITKGVLDKHAPIKKKYVRANQAPFMNKTLNKAIMNRSRLRNKFLANRTISNRNAYKKQRNYCTSLLRREKRNFYNSLDTKNITDNKLFWKTVKPFFSEKSSNRDHITLIENEQIVSENQANAEIFNDFFSSIVKNLNIPINDELLNNVHDIHDPVLRAIKKYERHPSIVKIKNRIPDMSALSFAFNFVTPQEIERELKSLNPSKASQSNDIPTKILKENCDIFAKFVATDFNDSILRSVFPKQLKLADIIPVFKKDSRTSKQNYRPISILPNLSKVYERCIYKQMSSYFDSILSKFQCGFRKGYSAQHCLIAMLEKWRSCVDNGEYFGVLLTDLSKAFDCLNHELLIAKLDAYGFDISATRLINDFLTNRKQRVKINDIFSSWKDLLDGVPQGSILGPLLFNIHLCDLFYFLTNIDIASYADDTSPYSLGATPEDVIQNIEEASTVLLKWFKENFMKANADKCHLLLSTNDKFTAKIDTASIRNSQSEKLLGITIDSKLTFEPHITNICDKASKKVHALARVACHMNTEKRRLIMKAFISSQFGYCPLVWMSHSRSLNNRINRIHERSLRIVYRDKNSSFQSLLEKDNSVSIHNRNLQSLATEMYKVKNQLSPKIMTDVFRLREISYNLRNNTDFMSKNVHSVRYGTESLSYLGPKIWSLVPDDIKNSKSLTVFKSKIQKWIPENCPCRLCKTYLQYVGFI